MEIQFHYSLKYSLGSFGVSGFVWREDEEIVHVDHQPPFGYHIPKRVIHESLECCWRVAKSEEHDCWFEKTSVCDKSRLSLVSIFDTDIVVSPSYVKLGEKFGPL